MDLLYLEVAFCLRVVSGSLAKVWVKVCYFKYLDPLWLLAGRTEGMYIYA